MFGKNTNKFEEDFAKFIKKYPIEYWSPCNPVCLGKVKTKTATEQIEMKQWKYNNFYRDYEIGDGTRIGSFCDIAGKIGKNCIIQSYVFIPSGVTIEDGCFIGPGVIFGNDKYPPSDGFAETYVREGARIGMRAVILPGIEIGKGAMVGAGAVVTKNVNAGETVVGNPAQELNKAKFNTKILFNNNNIDHKCPLGKAVCDHCGYCNER